MMRYQIFTLERSTKKLVQSSEASNRPVAEAEYTRLVKESRPGEEVSLIDGEKMEKGETTQKVLKTNYKRTPEDLEAEVQRALARYLSEDETAKSKLIKFANKIISDTENEKADPLYELGWSNELFKTAAELEVRRALRHAAAEEGLTLEALHSRCRENALRGARWPSQSSSAMTKAAERELTSAWAEFEEKLRHLLLWRNTKD